MPMFCRQQDTWKQNQTRENRNCVDTQNATISNWEEGQEVKGYGQ